MGRLFGTDGVRGIANTELTCELAFRLGQACARVLGSTLQRPSILVGRDTRISGEMLEAALTSGICSQGGRAVLLGVLPTPGIAYVTRLYEADAGVVISASHNTVEYNGIKFFDAAGCKLPDAVEDEMEALLERGLPTPPPVGAAVGRPIRQPNALRQYMTFLQSTATASLEGLSIVLDCANGAVSRIAPAVLEALGAKVSTFYHEPDGTNINEKCGSTHPWRLRELVMELGADIGLAFDGDADRLIAVDERGRIVDGDKILCIAAIALQREGRLSQNTVVTTIMANMGLEIAMEAHGIHTLRTKVGDRYVLEKMLAQGLNVGGEQSGHLIFLDHNTTGDGMVSAITLLGIMAKEKKPLSQLAKVMHALPQATASAYVQEDKKEMVMNDPEILAAVDVLSQKYEGRGRTLVRPSGTEPVIRVMVEGDDQGEIERDAAELARVIEGRGRG